MLPESTISPPCPLHFQSYFHHCVEEKEEDDDEESKALLCNSRKSKFLVIHLPSSTSRIPPSVSKAYPFYSYVVPIKNSLSCSFHSHCVTMASKHMAILDGLDLEWQPTLYSALLDNPTCIPSLSKVVFRIPYSKYNQVDAKEMKEKWIDSLITLGQNNVMATSEFKQGWLVPSTQVVVVPDTSDPPVAVKRPCDAVEVLPYSLDPEALWNLCVQGQFDGNLPSAHQIRCSDIHAAKLPINQLLVPAHLQAMIGWLDRSLVKVHPVGQTHAAARWMRLTYGKATAICLSSLDYFHLHQPTQIDIEPTFATSLPVLDEVQVSLVHSPSRTVPLHYALAELGQYLQTHATVLHPEDLLPVSLSVPRIELYQLCTHNAAETDDLAFLNTGRGEEKKIKVYFKVTHLAHPGQTSAATRILHHGTVHTRVLPTSVAATGQRRSSLPPLPVWIQQHALFQWVSTALHPHARMPVHTTFEGPKGIGKRTMVEQMAKFLGVPLYVLDARTFESKDHEKQLWKSIPPTGLVLLLHLPLSNLVESFLPLCPIPLIATTTKPCPTMRAFIHHHTWSLPNELRPAWIEAMLPPNLFLSPSITQWLGKHTTSLTPRDLVAFFKFLISSSSTSAEWHAPPSTWHEANVVDLSPSLSQVQRALHGYTKKSSLIPKVYWEDIGGLAAARTVLLRTFQWPMQYPELFKGRPSSGVLLYGPPGTGKTMLAKAVATECAFHFMSVKGPELLNMYVGTSEENVRALFQRARAMRPTMLFFDELDALAPKRSGDTDVMDKVVAQLLTEMDFLPTQVCLMGATNRPDLLDPALLRPGRLDRCVFVDVPDTHDVLSILHAHTRDLPLHPDHEFLSHVAQQCPAGLTGADLSALVADTTVHALSRCIHTVAAPFTITLHDFTAALEQLVPSVSESELQHYRHLEKTFSNKRG